MGRLQGARARVLLTLVLVGAVPLSVVAADRLAMSTGAPGISLTLAIVVVHLLSIGPRGAPLAWGAFVLHGVVVGGNDPSLGLGAVAAAQAAVAVACVRLVELRFARRGPVRHPLVMVDFGLIAGGALPMLVVLAGAGLTPLVGAEPWPGPVEQQVLAEGIGVLAVTAGLRMVALGDRISLDRSAVLSIVVATVVTTSAVLATLAVGGLDALTSSQVLLLPVLLVALLVGVAAYAIAMALTTVGTVTAAALVGTAGAWSVSTPTQAVWWLVAFCGLLLATDGDRRRATAVEFRTFFMRSATPSVSVNAATSTINRANEAVAALLGRPVEDLVGSSVVRLVEHEPEVAARLEQMLTGEVHECSEEFVLPSQHDRQRWVRCTATRVEVGGLQPDVLQVQFLDLTAERERSEALQRSNQALERFGRRVTHDLKQPLSAVAAYAGTLNEHAERLEPSVIRTMYERLEAVARRAVAQLDETFAATAMGDSAASAVGLDEAIASVAAVVDIELSEAGGTIDTDLSVARVRADASVLQQVLLNLVTNSLKYAEDDTPPRVHVAARVRAAGVEITVTDNGTGIPADRLEDVFVRGSRLDPSRADGRGHGLADSRELAEDAGGWLRAEPWPDGARFVLWLPDPGVEGSEEPTRVLLVEVEPARLSALQRRLDPQPSVEVVGSATTIEGAVAATRDLRPDVVLLDRRLHQQDGSQGVVELARAHRDVRIVLLAAEIPSDLPDRARSDGVLHTVAKGLSGDDLAAQVRGRGSR